MLHRFDHDMEFMKKSRSQTKLHSMVQVNMRIEDPLPWHPRSPDIPPLEIMYGHVMGDVY